MTPRSVRPAAPSRVQEPAISRLSSVPMPLYGGSTREAFAWHIAKYLDERATVTAMPEIEEPTWPGRMVTTVDFLIEMSGRRIAVECSGAIRLKENVQQRRRDARLVASGAVDTIYRIGGTDVAGCIDDALHLIASWERRAGAGRYLPDVFTARGRANLGRLAAPEVRTTDLQATQAAALVEYRTGKAARRRTRRLRGRKSHLLVRRFDRRFPSAWQHDAPLAPRALSDFIHLTAA